MLTEQGEREPRAERQSLRYQEQERKQTEELVRSRRGKEGRGQGRGEGETNSLHFTSVHFGQIEQKLQTKEGGNRA